MVRPVAIFLFDLGRVWCLCPADAITCNDMELLIFLLSHQVCGLPIHQQSNCQPLKDNAQCSSLRGWYVEIGYHHHCRGTYDANLLS